MALNLKPADLEPATADYCSRSTHPSMVVQAWIMIQGISGSLASKTHLAVSKPYAPPHQLEAMVFSSLSSLSPCSLPGTPANAVWPQHLRLQLRWQLFQQWEHNLAGGCRAAGGSSRPSLNHQHLHPSSNGPSPLLHDPFLFPDTV